MEPAELIQSLGSRLNIELGFDENGTCGFEADGMVVTIFNLPEINAVVLNGDIGEPPPEKLETLYASMLEANHCFQGTAGATLSRSPETGKIGLFKALSPVLLDGETFAAEVERFVNVLELWTKIVKNYREQSSDTEINAGETELKDGDFLRV